MSADSRVPEPIKPPRLKSGDAVAVVSTSWGGPSVFPHVFDRGVDVLRRVFELEVRELPTARMAARELGANPRRRADDLNDAFADPSIRAIIMSIGGVDSVRILEHLDASLAVANPKILLGFSDSATQLVFYNQAGLVTFNGPSLMAGFAQLERFEGAADHVRALLFEPRPSYDYRPSPIGRMAIPIGTSHRTQARSGNVDRTTGGDGCRAADGRRGASMVDAPRCSR